MSPCGSMPGTNAFAANKYGPLCSHCASMLGLPTWEGPYAHSPRASCRQRGACCAHLSLWYASKRLYHLLLHIVTFFCYHTLITSLLCIITSFIFTYITVLVSHFSYIIITYYYIFIITYITIIITYYYIFNMSLLHHYYVNITSLFQMAETDRTMSLLLLIMHVFIITLWLPIITIITYHYYILLTGQIADASSLTELRQQHWGNDIWQWYLACHINQLYPIQFSSWKWESFYQS